MIYIGGKLKGAGMYHRFMAVWNGAAAAPVGFYKAGSAKNSARTSPVKRGALGLGIALSLPSLAFADFSINQTVPATAQPGGPIIPVSDFIFEGNTAFPSEVLSQIARLSLFGLTGADTLPPKGTVKQAYFAELSNAVSAIEEFYREQGFPLVLVYIPPQQLLESKVKIIVTEGRYGTVETLNSEPDWQSSAGAWTARIVPNAIVRQSDLERTALLMNDLPGAAATIVVEPGDSYGTADVIATLDRSTPLAGAVSLSNHGSRFSGELQARANLDLNSFFVLGDKLSLTGVHTNEDMWQGQFGYSFPIGGDGFRAQIDYSVTQYDLTKAFEGTSGEATQLSLGVSYPIIRSSNSNLSVLLQYSDKELYNNLVNGLSVETYGVRTAPVTVSFDRRDSFLGGAVNYGSVTLTYGDLDKDDLVRRGAFSKFNWDIARLQNLPNGLSLFVRASGQATNENLDSSEGFGISGPASVRAYPSGDAFGDEGWLTQLELRYTFENYTPYAFYDHGEINVNAKPEQLALPSLRQVRSGVGVGMRFSYEQWTGDLAIAWSADGNSTSSSQTDNRNQRAWLTVSRRF